VAEFHRAGSVAEFEEACHAAAFGFKGVDGECLKTAAAGVGDMIGASGDGALIPGIDDVENQRRVNADGRMQAVRRLPGAVTEAGDEFAVAAGGVEGNGDTIDGDCVTGVDEALNFDLKALDGGIDAADGAPAAGLFAENIPGFDGLAEFEMDSAGAWGIDGAEHWQTEFEVRGEPFGLYLHPPSASPTVAI